MPYLNPRSISLRQRRLGYRSLRGHKRLVAQLAIGHGRRPTADEVLRTTTMA
jgi:hypothetical protein